jgi:hypothetical protein
VLRVLFARALRHRLELIIGVCAIAAVVAVAGSTRTFASGESWRHATGSLISLTARSHVHPASRPRVDTLCCELRALLAVTRERLAAPDTSVAGTPIDARHDAVFVRIERAADRLGNELAATVAASAAVRSASTRAWSSASSRCSSRWASWAAATSASGSSASVSSRSRAPTL